MHRPGRFSAVHPTGKGTESSINILLDVLSTEGASVIARLSPDMIVTMLVASITRFTRISSIFPAVADACEMS
jgi:hypothetical protein